MNKKLNEITLLFAATTAASMLEHERHLLLWESLIAVYDGGRDDRWLLVVSALRADGGQSLGIF